MSRIAPNQIIQTRTWGAKPRSASPNCHI